MTSVNSDKPLTSNPFYGFAGLTSSSALSDSNNTNNTNTSLKIQTSSVSTGPVVVVSSSSSGTNGEESDFKKKLKKLNNSFFSWVSRQIVENPVCIWKDGLKVDHCYFLLLHYYIIQYKSFNQ